MGINTYCLNKKGKPMNRYNILRLEADKDWSVLPVLQLNNRYLQTTDEVHAYAQIGHREDALLVHMWIDVAYIRAEENGRLGMPCLDSCLEFFFQPVPGDPRYINMEFNFNGCMFLGIGSCIQDVIRLLPESDPKAIFCPDIRRTPTGWEIYYQIPYAFIRRLFPGFEATAGLEIRANCYTCSELSPKPYSLSWNLVQPKDDEPLTFHCTRCFGSMILTP